MAAADEQTLILQAQQGNHEAYRTLVERHMKQAYNVAYSFVNDHANAEDVAQEAFIRAYRSLPSFRGEAGFGTWLLVKVAVGLRDGVTVLVGTGVRVGVGVAVGIDVGVVVSRSTVGLGGGSTSVGVGCLV